MEGLCSEFQLISSVLLKDNHQLALQFDIQFPASYVWDIPNLLQMHPVLMIFPFGSKLCSVPCCLKTFRVGGVHFSILIAAALAAMQACSTSNNWSLPHAGNSSQGLGVSISQQLLIDFFSPKRV